MGAVGSTPIHRFKWFRQRYLSVGFGEEKQHCRGFGYHGNLLLTNWTPQHDRLREHLGRPVARFDRFYRIDGRFTPQETRFVWSVFERGAVFQKFEYYKEGFLERVTALFVSQQEAQEAILQVYTADGQVLRVGKRGGWKIDEL